MRYYFTRPGTAGLPKGRDWMKNLYKAGMGRFAAICLVVLMVFSTGNLYAFADEAGNGDTSTSSSEDGGDTGSTVRAKNPIMMAACPTLKRSWTRGSLAATAKTGLS